MARGGPIREANQDSEAALRARIGQSRSELIERGSQLLVSDTTKPLYGALLNLVARGGIEPPTRGFSVLG